MAEVADQQKPAPAPKTKPAKATKSAKRADKKKSPDERQGKAKKSKQDKKAKKAQKGKKGKKAKKLSLQPEGFGTVTPSLIVHDGKAAIAFYKKVLGAELLVSYDMGGKVGHAELTIGDSIIALADEFPEFGAVSARTLKGSPVINMVYVKDCDKAVAKAVKHGATVTRPAEDQFWGDRNAQIQDPFGHLWTLAQRVEDLSAKEIKKRMAKLG